MATDQLLDTRGPVDPGPTITDPDLAPASQRLADQEQMGHPAAQILGVVALRLSRGGGQRRSDLTAQLPTRLVQTDDRMGRVVGTVAPIKQVLHVPDKLRVGLRRNAPRLPQPQFEFVCFQVRRTVSEEMASTISSRTYSSANSRSV